MNSLGKTVFSIIVVAGLATVIERYDEDYGWSYALIILLGVIIFNNSAFTRFINFALNQRSGISLSSTGSKRPTRN